MKFIGEQDIFQQDVECIVNAVNTVGVMGSGLARAFREKYNYTSMFESYRLACMTGECAIGHCHVWTPPDIDKEHPIAVNFPTKDHWRWPSRIEYIYWAMEDLRSILTNLQIKSVAIPRLGCGLGGLDWPNVRYSIRHSLETLEACEVIVLGDETD